MVMTPLGNCFSAGVSLRIEMRYANWKCFAGVSPECGVLFALCYFKHEKPGGWGYENIGKPVSYDGYVHVLCFI